MSDQSNVLFTVIHEGDCDCNEIFKNILSRLFVNTLGKSVLLSKISLMSYKS